MDFEDKEQNKNSAGSTAVAWQQVNTNNNHELLLSV
jgi:hypothetical protein